MSKKYVTHQKNPNDFGYCGFIFGMWCDGVLCSKVGKCANEK